MWADAFSVGFCLCLIFGEHPRVTHIWAQGSPVSGVTQWLSWDVTVPAEVPYRLTLHREIGAGGELFSSNYSRNNTHHARLWLRLFEGRTFGAPLTGWLLGVDTGRRKRPGAAEERGPRW